MDTEKIDSEAIDDPTEDEFIQNHALIRNFIDPVQSDLKEMVGREIELNVLRKMAHQRNKMVHKDTKSVKQQRSFF
jgi:hypothetical protein